VSHVRQHPCTSNRCARSARQPVNGLGIAGFVVSLVSFLTCGLISPIALILSLFALWKRPRGFAVAGTLLGMVGTGILSLAIMLPLAAAREARQRHEHDRATARTNDHIARANALIEQRRAQDGSLPGDSIGQQLILGVLDGFGAELHYRRLSDDRFEIRSAGADGIFHNADDSTNLQTETRVPRAY
jgi:hypothetical protein